jgi:flagellar protein FlgJ
VKKQDFIDKYLPFAKETEVETGISAIFILAQAALETGWGKSCPGNMMFGIKANYLDDKRQLLRTVEYSTKPDLVFPEIISVTQVGDKYKYVIKDWFRAYDTPEQSFTDHAMFFFQNSRYKFALMVKGDPTKFAEAVAQAGYATDPDYAIKLISIIEKICELVDCQN